MSDIFLWFSVVVTVVVMTAADGTDEADCRCQGRAQVRGRARRLSRSSRDRHTAKHRSALVRKAR